MTLIASKRKPVYRWQEGDLITPLEAARLLGWSSARNLQGDRLKFVLKDFEAARCNLNCEIWIGGQRRFLRSEIDEYLTKKVEAAQILTIKRRSHLSLPR